MRMSAIGDENMNMAFSNPRDSEHRNWQNQEYCLQKDSGFVSSVDGSQWNEVTLNAEDLSYMLDDETTPVKACGDLAYNATYCGNMSMEPKECRETSLQVKRRRMLQFDNRVVHSSFCCDETPRRMLQFDTQVVDSSSCCDEMPSAFLKANEREDTVEQVFPEALPWTTGISDVSASGCDNLDQEFEGWIAQCLNDPEMNFSPDDMNFSGVSDLHIDISESGNSPSVHNANAVQQQITRTPCNVVFKGTKSLIQNSPRLASSVTYPFAFIKPCGVRGDVTLKDINQRILTPPSKLKQNIEDCSAYPTSAFSGKPVVGKTKIRTEGGKGSITIMRTKG